MVVIPLVGVLALLAWLLTAGILAIGMAPSSSPSENMNGLALGLLPYTVLPASVLTATALFIGGACARSPLAKTIMFVLGAAAMIFPCLGAALFFQANGLGALINPRYLV
jgi:hypothetical protein